MKELSPGIRWFAERMEEKLEVWREKDLDYGRVGREFSSLVDFSEYFWRDLPRISELVLQAHDKPSVETLKTALEALVYGALRMAVAAELIGACDAGFEARFRFRKKYEPFCLVEAFQMTKERLESNVDWRAMSAPPKDWPKWLCEACGKNAFQAGSLSVWEWAASGGRRLMLRKELLSFLPDADGVVRLDRNAVAVEEGDWIVREEGGELDVWSDEEFKTAFEPIA